MRLENEVPVLTQGVGGYGGVCPQGQFPADIAFDVELGIDPGTGEGPTGPVTLYSGPDTATSKVDDPAVRYAMLVDDWIVFDDWLVVDGWTQVRFFGEAGQDNAFDDYGSYQPCAWIQTPG